MVRLLSLKGQDMLNYCISYSLYYRAMHCGEEKNIVFLFVMSWNALLVTFAKILLKELRDS